MHVLIVTIHWLQAIDSLAETLCSITSSSPGRRWDAWCPRWNSSRWRRHGQVTGSRCLIILYSYNESAHKSLTIRLFLFLNGRPGVVKALEEFKLSVYGENYDEESDSIASGKTSDASKKRKAIADKATEESAKVDWSDLADKGEVTTIRVCLKISRMIISILFGDTLKILI